jgi:ribonuclease HII
MVEADAKWPVYEFAKHKGYGTRAHMAALHAHGPCPIHRRTFKPVPQIIARTLKENVPDSLQLDEEAGVDAHERENEQ